MSRYTMFFGGGASYHQRGSRQAKRNAGPDASHVVKSEPVEPFRDVADDAAADEGWDE